MSGFPLREGTIHRLGSEETGPVDPAKLQPMAPEQLPPDLANLMAAGSPATPEPAATGQRTVQESMAELEALTAKAKALQEQEEQRIKDSIAAEDRIQFVRAMLANLPYSKSYKCFGDAVQLTFRTLTMAEYSATAEAVVIASGRVPYPNMQAISLAHFKFAMTCCLSKMTLGDKETIFRSPLDEFTQPASTTYFVRNEHGTMVARTEDLAPVPGQCVLWATDKRFEKLSAPVFNAVMATFKQFDEQVAMMTREAQNPSFFPTTLGP